MEKRLAAVLDHVACAVPDPDAAERRWREELGGGLVAWGETPGFRSRQLRFAGGGKLELLSPPADATPANFVRRFLERFGSGVHHVTLKVAKLAAALEILDAAGLDTVDVDLSNDDWKEAFLRPSQVGGLVVQVAESRWSDEGWAAHVGHVPEPPRPGAASLLGPRLRFPDLGEARTLWELLGAEVASTGGRLTCAWPDSALTVEVVEGERPGPEGLRFRGTKALAADPVLGAAVLAEG